MNSSLYFVSLVFCFGLAFYNLRNELLINRTRKRYRKTESDMLTIFCAELLLAIVPLMNTIVLLSYAADLLLMTIEAVLKQYDIG